MRFVKMPHLDPAAPQLYARYDEDGLCRLTCILEHAELQQFIADGGVIEEPDA